MWKKNKMVERQHLNKEYTMLRTLWKPTGEAIKQILIWFIFKTTVRCSFFFFTLSVTENRLERNRFMFWKFKKIANSDEEQRCIDIFFWEPMKNLISSLIPAFPNFPVWSYGETKHGIRVEQTTSCSQPRIERLASLCLVQPSLPMSLFT